MQFERSLAAFFSHHAGGLADGAGFFGHTNIILQSLGVCQVLLAELYRGGPFRAGTLCDTLEQNSGGQYAVAGSRSDSVPGSALPGSDNGVALAPIVAI